MPEARAQDPQFCIQERQEGAMDADALKKAFNELCPHLESQETQITALLEFLTVKGMIKKEDFDPFLEEAGNRSSVKWLAARLRIEHALSESTEEEEKPAEIATKPPAQEPEEEPPQENEGWRASDRAEEEPRPDKEEREPEQTGKRTEPGKQSENASEKTGEEASHDEQARQPDQTDQRTEPGEQPG